MATNDDLDKAYTDALRALREARSALYGLANAHDRQARDHLLSEPARDLSAAVSAQRDGKVRGYIWIVDSIMQSLRRSRKEVRQ